MRPEHVLVLTGTATASSAPMAEVAATKIPLLQVVLFDVVIRGQDAQVAISDALAIMGASVAILGLMFSVFRWRADRQAAKIQKEKT